MRSRLQHRYCIGVSRRSAQATAGKGLAQGPYMAARAGVEPTTLRLRVIASTNASPCPTMYVLYINYISYIYGYFKPLAFLVDFLIVLMTAAYGIQWPSYDWNRLIFYSSFIFSLPPAPSLAPPYIPPSSVRIQRVRQDTSRSRSVQNNDHCQEAPWRAQCKTISWKIAGERGTATVSASRQ